VPLPSGARPAAVGRLSGACTLPKRQQQALRAVGVCVWEALPLPSAFFYEIYIGIKNTLEVREEQVLEELA